MKKKNIVQWKITIDTFTKYFYPRFNHIYWLNVNLKLLPF